jgi:hypothetical protein
MTVTFENDKEVIVYALEKIIAYARQTQQVFVAHCIWWIASVIGLESGLISHIDNLHYRTVIGVQHGSEPGKDPASTRAESTIPRDIQEGSSLGQASKSIEGNPSQDESSPQVHPDRLEQIFGVRAVSAVPRDLTEDQRLDRILGSAERVIQESLRDRGASQQNRVNPLPTTKTQLKKARKTKRLQEARDKEESKRHQRLKDLRVEIIKRLSKE